MHSSLTFRSPFLSLFSAGEQRADFERSFVDVSSEADAIRDDARHTGLYVNNNEKNDDFEVIDDGSQQGGMRNFEDKSFERSGRSSLLSSVRTDLVSDSIESEVPLEISMDAEKTTTNNKDDYDIVQIGEESRTTSTQKNTLLDINKLAGGRERAPSPGPESNINVNKYLFSDNDDDGDDDNEPETSGTFNIDMYFATEEKSNKNEEQNLQNDEPTNEQHEERINSSLERPSKDNNEDDDDDDDDDTLPEIVSQEESEDKSSSTVVLTEQGVDSSSPFLEVKSQVNATASNSEAPLANSNHVRNLNENEAASEEEDENETDSQLNNAFVSNDVVSLPPEEEDTTLAVVKDSDELDSRSNNEASVTTIDKTSMSLDIDQDIRKSVEDLYEQILSEDSQGDPMSGDEGLLPPDATFGEPIGLTGKSPVDGPPKKKEGWLVRVESFSTPATCTPQIKVIKDGDGDMKTDGVTVVLPEEHENATTNPTDNDLTKQRATDGAESPAPVPKERKKKKKKKDKRKSVEIVEEDHDSASELRPGSASDSPAVSPSKRLDHSDIPKQFLDASNTLAGDSYSLSDTSDVEQEVLEDGTTINKKRSGSKKKNKESCKTQ